MAIAGQDFKRDRAGFVVARPARFKAVIEMSAPAPLARTPGALAKAFANVTIPIFHLTGTLDDSPIGETKAQDRRMLFDLSPADVPSFLLTFTGGDHFVFSGRRRNGDKPEDDLFHQLIQMGTTAFWDAYLKGDTSAADWFAAGGYQKKSARTGRSRKRDNGKGKTQRRREKSRSCGEKMRMIFFCATPRFSLRLCVLLFLLTPGTNPSLDVLRRFPTSDSGARTPASSRVAPGACGDEAGLQQIRLDHVDQRVDLFPHARADRLDPGGPPS
jgi:hypothetical protein